MAAPLIQGTPEWLDARRGLITATDIAVLIGLSPYKSEADLAAEKRGEMVTESTLRMRVGSALQDLIGEEYTRATGRAILPWTTLYQHPEITWAGASPDFYAKDEQLLVEAKWTGSRNRFADGLPDDVRAQVAWQLMVTGYPAADVAVLVGGDSLLPPFRVERDVDMERDLVAIAEDFRARLAAGGPFAESPDYVRRRYPKDDGSTIEADPELTEAVRALVAIRERRKALEDDAEHLETAIKTRMGEAARLEGDGFVINWKRTKDVTTVDWKSVADGLLRTLPGPERTALVGIATTVKPGFRPFRVVLREGNSDDDTRSDG